MLFTSFLGYAQKEANHWYFGHLAGLDFSSGSPVPATNGNLITEEGCATISDRDGNLLFYTDGSVVYNRLHQLMPNGKGLLGNISSTQSAVIVRKPGSDSIYYIFTIGSESQTTGFCYSTVNIRKDNGNGDVIEKNINLYLGAHEKIGAVLHCDQKSVWVVIKQWDSDAYLSYLVTSKGVSGAPVISHSGNLISGNTANSIGVLKFSSDGTKMATANGYGGNFVELMNFDSKNGLLSTARILNAQVSPFTIYCGTYGAEFSPDSHLLYITSFMANQGFVDQFDVTLGTQAAIQSSQQTILSDNDGTLGSAQLGPDKKIYITSWNSNKLTVIRNPNNHGAACNLAYKSLTIGDSLNHYAEGGLPSFVQSYFAEEQFAFDFSRSGSCANTNVNFLINKTRGADSVRWNFGDPASANNISTQFNPAHSYAAAGTYTVSMIVFKRDCTGQNDTLSKSIWINPIPDDILGPDRKLCAGQSIQTLIPAGNTNILWSDGSTGPSLDIQQSGTYWVKISQEGCLQTDTLNVDYLPLPKVYLGPDSSICPGQTVVLDAGNPGYSYSWNSGETSKSITVLKTGDYSVKVTTPDHCSASDTIRILPGVCDVFMPNAFSPNGDGLNDGFGILTSTALVKYSLVVYDRWGELVFTTTEKRNRWDGTFKGKPMPVGTYSWILGYQTITDNQYYTRKGTVSLVR